MGTQPKLIRMSIRVEVAKKVKVRAYIRIRNDRIQKVRSHYSIPSVFYSEFIKKHFPCFETLSSLKKFVNCVPLELSQKLVFHRQSIGVTLDCKVTSFAVEPALLKGRRDMREKTDKELYVNFDEYIRQGEPSQREAAYAQPILSDPSKQPTSTPTSTPTSFVHTNNKNIIRLVKALDEVL